MGIPKQLEAEVAVLESLHADLELGREDVSVPAMSLEERVSVLEERLSAVECWLRGE